MSRSNDMKGSKAMKPMKAMKAMKAMKVTKVTLGHRALAADEAWRKAEVKYADAMCKASALLSASSEKKAAACAAVAAYTATASDSESDLIADEPSWLAGNRGIVLARSRDIVLAGKIMSPGRQPSHPVDSRVDSQDD